jgi:hypothetical protein
MAITSSEILNKVNQITGRGFESVDDIKVNLEEALIQIGEQGALRKTSTSGSTTAGQSYIDAPSDLLSLEKVYIDDVLYDFITWEEYLDNCIRGVVLRDGKIYIRPNPTSSQSYTIYYSKTHAGDADNIEFDDRYKPAIYRLVASKVYDDYEQIEKADRQRQLYRIELQRLIDNQPDNTPLIVQGRRGEPIKSDYE